MKIIHDHNALHAAKKYILHLVHHFVAVRTFEHDFDIMDGDEPTQIDGHVHDYALQLGDRGTWYELCDNPYGDGMIRCQCCQEMIYGVVCKGSEDDSYHWGCFHSVQDSHADRRGGWKRDLSTAQRRADAS